MHGKIIDALGGFSIVAKDLSKLTQTNVSPQMVFNWKKDGISWRYRPAIVELALSNRNNGTLRGVLVDVPNDFLIK